MNVTRVCNVDHLCSFPFLNVDIEDQEFKRDPIDAEIANGIEVYKDNYYAVDIKFTGNHCVFHFSHILYRKEEDNVIRDNMEIKTINMDKLV